MFVSLQRNICTLFVHDWRIIHRICGINRRCQHLQHRNLTTSTFEIVEHSEGQDNKRMPYTKENALIV